MPLLLIVIIVILFVAFGKDNRPIVEAGKESLEVVKGFLETALGRTGYDQILYLPERLRLFNYHDLVGRHHREPPRSFNHCCNRSLLTVKDDLVE